ncbi:hypothetical protein PPYR_12628 [Photinus pyralis]|uniref:Uncharacterized protein n=1 Tax=Photinus pyralis TaxID=7054 RepID=A0A5N4A6X0_PHOPY|nr:hypothetical protein PPYR_12628 [Photinus pyralis]
MWASLFLLLFAHTGKCLADFAFISNLDRDVEIQSCVARVIEQTFGLSRRFTYIYNDYIEYLPSAIANPIIVINARKPWSHHYNFYEAMYVIEAFDSGTLRETMKALKESTLWHPHSTREGKFVILTNEKDLASIFRAVWKFSILHVVLVVFEDGTNGKVVTSDPKTQENGCGLTPKLFDYQDCDANLAIKFLSPMRNYNQCPVFIDFHNPYDHRLKYIKPLLPVIEDVLNTTSIRVREPPSKPEMMAVGE